MFIFGWERRCAPGNRLPNFAARMQWCFSETGIPARSRRTWAGKQFAGEGLSSPIIIAERVFVPAGLETTKAHVLCFNATDGSKRWSASFGHWPYHVSRENQRGRAHTRSDGRHIVALFPPAMWSALISMQLVLVPRLGRDYPNATTSRDVIVAVIADGVSSPSGERERIIQRGLDLSSGVNRWKIDRPNTQTGRLHGVEDGGRISLRSSLRSVIAVEPATGKVVWESTRAAPRSFQRKAPACLRPLWRVTGFNQERRRTTKQL